MNYFIGYNSALEHWRSGSATPRRISSRALPTTRGALDRIKIECLELERIGITNKPVHFIVSHPSCRAQTKRAICHVLSTEPPSGSFQAVADSVYVSSPELLFVQKATELSLTELMLLGIEFCSTYTIDRSDMRGFRTREPLTNKASLARYIERAGAMRGVKKARRALCCTVDNSASPMETILTMLLCLPCSLGGYGIELPTLNGRVDLNDPYQTRTHGRFYVCDMLWRTHRLVVEYDSTMYHTGEDRITRDSRRRVDLIAEGYTVVTVTKQQVFNSKAFDAIGYLLRRHTNKARPNANYDLAARRYELRRTLLGGIQKTPVGNQSL